MADKLSQTSDNNMASTASLRFQAKWGYRRLLRAANVAFKDDMYVIDQAKQTLRQHYASHADVTDPAELTTLVDGITEVETMLRENIVQGRQNSDGRYEVKLTPPQQNEQITPITPGFTPQPSSCGCNSEKWMNGAC